MIVYCHNKSYGRRLHISYDIFTNVQGVNSVALSVEYSYYVYYVLFFFNWKTSMILVTN